MQKTIEVVYEEGVFKPLEKVELEEGEKIRVDIMKFPEKLFGILYLRKYQRLLLTANEIKIATTTAISKSQTFTGIFRSSSSS